MPKKHSLSPEGQNIRTYYYTIPTFHHPQKACHLQKITPPPLAYRINSLVITAPSYAIILGELQIILREFFIILARNFRHSLRIICYAPIVFDLCPLLSPQEWNKINHTPISRNNLCRSDNFFLQKRFVISAEKSYHFG